MLKKKQIIGMLEANELVGSIGTFSCQDMNNQNIVVSGILVKRNDHPDYFHLAKSSYFVVDGTGMVRGITVPCYFTPAEKLESRAFNTFKLGKNLLLSCSKEKMAQSHPRFASELRYTPSSENDQGSTMLFSQLIKSELYSLVDWDKYCGLGDYPSAGIFADSTGVTAKLTYGFSLEDIDMADLTGLSNGVIAKGVPGKNITYSSPLTKSIVDKILPNLSKISVACVRDKDFNPVTVQVGFLREHNYFELQLTLHIELIGAFQSVGITSSDIRFAARVIASYGYSTVSNLEMVDQSGAVVFCSRSFRAMLAMNWLSRMKLMASECRDQLVRFQLNKSCALLQSYCCRA